MDEDFYVENTSPWKVVFIILFVLILIAGGIWAYYKYFPSNNVKLKAVTIELGDKVSSNINDYISGKNINDYTLDVSNVHVNSEGNTDSAGVYSYKIISNKTIKKGKIYVKDTTIPEANVKELTVGVNEEFDPDEFLESCNDYSLPCTASYKNIDDASLNTKEGTYKTQIIISDNAGNKITKDVTLIVSSTTTLESIKENDFIVSYTNPEDKEWNNTFTYKFSKCIDDEDKTFEGTIEEYTSKEYTFDKTIKDRTLLVAYNKYGYAIGLSVKLIFDDNTIVYVTE